MKIIKICNHVSLFSLINLSKVILYNFKLFGMFTNELIDYTSQKKFITNERKLAEPGRLRLGKKRIYDISLTMDEIEDLNNILHCEALCLNDLVSSFIIFLSRGNHPTCYDAFIREKVRERVALSVPGYPVFRKQNMKSRLTEQMHEIIKTLPFNRDGIFYVYEFLKLEIDESEEILYFASTQKTEEHKNIVLNNLPNMRALLTARLLRNNIIVNDDMVTEAVLRVRRRVKDILDFHEHKLSRAHNN
ncbi:Plasmodium exported protein, unknown function [Plasmodium ovale wallikeri]|uniref:Uncharacterized protein n=2 Tax=Plasmodium ovale TaxID=36330 RepID=A0A1A9AJ75_PLAOA|nr:Plasmodium exported protein, unknown function [Plasmodium ovale wallikeri]SBT56670.1 Plasmodium exported protein, unknown function [Plasmodium ovale wallikeri]SBT79056.1 Plasmodium exported protein, unknown function [Plasmodium ovale]